MNIFLKKILYFLGILVFGISLFFPALHYKTKLVVNEPKIDSNIKTLFVGDSHVRHCFNADIIPNSMNLSNNSESYYFSYFKILSLLQSKTSVTKLYLGFSYHNLSSYYDDATFGKESESVAPKYFFILPNAEKLKLIKYNSTNAPLFLKHIITNNFNVSFPGNYENNFNNTSANKKSMDKRVAFHYFKNGKLNKFSDLNLKYLEKIAKLCMERNIELIFINTPLHKYYKSCVPIEYINKYNKTVSKYNSKVIDFNSLTFIDNCFLPDGDHVSQRGANIASKFMVNN